MITESAFREPWWLPGGHLQTLWPFAAGRLTPQPATERERLELPDGDYVDLHWLERPGAPLVCVFHGLEGCVGSHYAKRILRRLADDGFAVVLMHFRGCGGEPNRLARSYHSGDTGDIGLLLETLHGRFPGRDLLALGYSLGGNALLKYLGESGAQAVPRAAVAVSVPLLLGLCARRLESGVSRLYQEYLLARLKRSTRAKRALIDAAGVDFAAIQRARTFTEFDDRATAPLHGFRDAADYYARCSSRQFLSRIATPTLIVHARNDPFMFPGVLPEASELSERVTLEIARGGGHVGFVAGRAPWRARYWLDERVSRFLSAPPVPDVSPVPDGAAPGCPERTAT